MKKIIIPNPVKSFALTDLVLEFGKLKGIESGGNGPIISQSITGMYGDQHLQVTTFPMKFGTPWSKNYLYYQDGRACLMQIGFPKSFNSWSKAVENMLELIESGLKELKVKESSERIRSIIFDMMMSPPISGPGQSGASE
jgi:hypothetical protein